MKSISNTLLMLSLVSLFLGPLSCGQKELSLHEPNEARLRERINAAREHFVRGRFNEFIEMRSARQRRMMFESEQEKQKGLTEWRMFLDREKPTFELISVEIRGTTATAKMRGSILREDGSRSMSTTYDLWLFENGDWFLDTADRTSPEHFPKD